MRQRSSLPSTVKEPRPLHHTFYETLHSDPNCDHNREDRRRSAKYIKDGMSQKRRSMHTKAYRDMKRKVGWIATRTGLRRTIIYFLSRIRLNAAIKS